MVVILNIFFGNIQFGQKQVFGNLTIFTLYNNQDGSFEYVTLKEALAKSYIRNQEDQQGILVLLGGKVAGMDILSSPQAYETLHAKLIQSYAIDALTMNKPDDTSESEALAKECSCLTQNRQKQSPLIRPGMVRISVLNRISLMAPRWLQTRQWSLSLVQQDRE